VPSLDEDRILRQVLNLVDATVRTNFYQADGSGGLPTTLAFKLDSKAVEAAPQPRPFREIWVYSPRVEGVHLRFGPIARGGIRWSDRAQDFRTEVLGLVRAQLVKNAVIVPSGAKGGFLPKQMPRTGTREEIQKEGVAAYRIFISALLDLTDNIKDGKVVPPRQVVRHDGDDAYLVVAADKGTATFSDIANEISQRTASGWAMPSLPAARPATTTRRWRSQPAAPGSASSGISARWTSTSSASRSGWWAWAKCPATCSATACCSPSISSWWRPSITATSSSIPIPAPAPWPSASGCSSCRARAGRTTTRPRSPGAAGCSRAAPSRSR
jgi:hypothetical protein